MGEDNHTFEDLVVILPERWSEKAKKLGTLQRVREIKTPEDLLKLIFLYLTEGKSFGNTSALLSKSKSFHLTKKAIYTRTRAQVYGKLLSAAFCETWANKSFSTGSFPTWRYSSSCLRSASASSTVPFPCFSTIDAAFSSRSAFHPGQSGSEGYKGSKYPEWFFRYGWHPGRFLP
jgi:hypothetical protein